MSGVRELITVAIHCSADNASAEDMANAILAALAADRPDTLAIALADDRATIAADLAVARAAL